MRDETAITLRLQVLNGWRLSAEGRRLKVPGPKARALVSHLILDDRTVHRRQDLASLIWPKSSPERGRASLRQTIFGLRSALHPIFEDVFVARDTEIEVLSSNLTSDLEEIRDHVKSRRPTSELGPSILSVGDMLKDLESVGADYAAWLHALRTRTVEEIRRLIHDAMHDPRMDANARLQWAQMAYQLDDYDEEAVRAIMACYAEMQQAPAGLRVYAELYRRLEDEMDVEPSLQTQNLAVELKLSQADGADAGERPATSPVQPVERPSIVTVAVLPFESLSHEPLPNYVVLGLLDEITCSLAGLTAPAVISSNSTRGYIGQPPPVRIVGRELGAQYVVVGGIRSQGRDASVLVQVVAVESEQIVWANIYECARDDILGVRSTIAGAIAAAVAPSLHAAELRRTERDPHEDLEPFHLLLRAKDMIFQLSRETFFEAGRLIGEAIKKGAYLAPAYTLLAEWYSICIWQGWSDDPATHERALIAAARQAISLGPGEARAMALLGHNRVILSRKYDEASRLFSRALDLLPNDSETLIWTVPSLAYVGDAETAVANGKKAMALSPHDPFDFRNQHFLSIAHYAAGQYDEAIALGQNCFSSNPTYVSNIRMTIAAMAAAGRAADTDDLIKQHLAMEPDFRVGGYISRQAFKTAAARDNYARDLIEGGLPA